MSDSGKIRFAGDVNIENVSVVTSRGMTQNITNQLLSIELFEDLFSPFMTGVITVKDSFDFVNLFPFIGEEFIDVKVYTPSIDEKDYINQQFYIYKVSDRLLMGDRTVVYQLHIIAREAVTDVNKNVSRSYSGIISDIVKDICTNKEDGLESVKSINIEPTANKTKFISNFWSPIKCLNYVAGNATTSKGACNYLFFENRNGLNFVSLDSLYNQEPKMEFVYDNYARDVLSDGRSIINLNEDYKRITDIEIPVMYDYIDRIRSGMFSSKIITHDTVTKKYYSKNFNMLNDFVNNSHLNEFPAATNSNINLPNSLVINYPKNYGAFNQYTDVSNAKSLQKRISQLMQAETTKLNIDVLGRTDYTVGMKVKVKLNKVQPIGSDELEEDILDTILSGFYIVSAINHSINRDKHECSMELIKDSYIMNLNEGK
jgi:hypothetical protein